MRKQCLVPRPERGVGQGTFLMPLGGGPVSVLGSTLFYLGPVMGRRKTPVTNSDLAISPTPMLTARQWTHAVDVLHFTPQQARIVGLILQGKRDKQIAGQLRLSESTVRTHLRYIFARLSVSDRVELVLRVWATCGSRIPQSHIVEID